MQTVMDRAQVEVQDGSINSIVQLQVKQVQHKHGVMHGLSDLLHR